MLEYTTNKRFPYVIQELEPADINPKKPIKYRLSLDISKLKPARPPAGGPPLEPPGSASGSAV